MAANQPSSRKWIVEPVYSDETGELLASLDQQVSYRLTRLAVVLADIGGTVGVVAEREKIAEPDHYETVRVIIRWESFAPTRRPQAQAKPEPVPEPEPEAESPEPEPDTEPEPAAA